MSSDCPWCNGGTGDHGHPHHTCCLRRLSMIEAAVEVIDTEDIRRRCKNTLRNTNAGIHLRRCLDAIDKVQRLVSREEVRRD